MNSLSRPDDLSLASVLDLIRYRLVVLIEAIITNHPVAIYRSPIPWS